MIAPEFVKIVYLIGNDQDGKLEKTSGVLLAEGKNLIVVGEIKRKIVIGKRGILKIEHIKNPDARNLEILGI